MKLSILQWNVWCDEDIVNIGQFLKNNPADIICSQELTIDYPRRVIEHSPDYIAKLLGYDHYYKKLPIESTQGGKLMLANAIFSKFPILNKKYYWTNNPINSGGYSNEKRVYVEVGLEIEKQILTVGTTHMSYTHRFEATSQKKQETDKLFKYISKHKEMFVIAGDFNAAPGSYTIEKIEEELHNLGPDFSQKTWTTKPFSYNGFEENNLNWRLDHIFGTKDIKLIESKVLKTDLSDHLPILSIIEI